MPIFRGRRPGTAAFAAVVVAAGSVVVVVASAGPAAAIPPLPVPVCTAGTCTDSFIYTGVTQTFTVPSTVSTVTATVLGAEGGLSRFASVPGAGGSVRADLAVTGGDVLTVLAGQVGAHSGGSTFGGGGATGSNGYLGSGGGGSFLFAASGTLLIAAGGGGGAGIDGRGCAQTFLQAGGVGGGAGSAGGDGQAGCYSGETVPTGGGTSNPGLGGTGPVADGLPGTGPAAAFAPGTGGAGVGQNGGDVYVGAGGGGGYYGGGGGGYAQSGAGGSGYVTSAATGVVSQSGVHTGDGEVDLSWAQIATSIQLAAAPVVFGQSVAVQATLGSPTASVPGEVQFSVDGTDVGSPVSGLATPAGSVVDSPSLTGSGGSPLAPGTHQIGAVFTPDDAINYATSTQTVSQLINRARSQTALRVGPTTLTATITAVAPGAGTPTGTVTFSVAGTAVGSASVVNGVAVLHHRVAPGRTRRIAAVYGGDTNFTGSSASTSRVDPSITATLSSSRRLTRYGWYRRPVTVTFHCTTHGAPLVRPCPVPAHLTRTAAAQSVTRSITATNGGAATVVVRGINIDRVAPSLRVVGLRDGAVYRGVVVHGRCVGHDALSGLVGCAIVRHPNAGITRYVATATDRAGNTTTVTGSYRTLTSYIEAARFRRGAFDVVTGRAYTLVVYSRRQPTYYDAEKYPLVPFRRDLAFNASGHDRWTLTVTMTEDLLAHRYWNLGVKIGATMHLLRIRVS